MRHRCGVCDELERHRQWPCSEAVAQDRVRHTAVGHILVAHNEKYLRHKKDCGSEFETMTISRSWLPLQNRTTCRQKRQLLSISTRLHAADSCVISWWSESFMLPLSFARRAR